MFLMSVLSTESMANVFRCPGTLVLLSNALTLFKVERHRWASVVVIGVVMRIFNSPRGSEKVS